MVSQPPVTPDTIIPQSPSESGAQPIPVEAPPPDQMPERGPDGGGDLIEPGQTPAEVPPHITS
jgi:hypothetical protein